MGIRRASLVRTDEELTRQVRWVLDNYGQDCLVEAFAPGREFCVGLLGNGKPEVLPIAEIRTAGDFYSYEDKHEHRKELICPAKISGELAQEMTEMALTVFRLLDCRDLARADLKLDGQGQPAFLEINPLPGLSPYYSIYPQQAEAAGIAFGELIGQIIELACRRHRQAERPTRERLG